MPDDRLAAIGAETMLRDCDKVAVLLHVLSTAWEAAPSEPSAEYWQGIVVAIETILEL